MSVRVNGLSRGEITQGDSEADRLRREQLAELSQWVRQEQQRLCRLVEINAPIIEARTARGPASRSTHSEG